MKHLYRALVGLTVLCIPSLSQASASEVSSQQASSSAASSEPASVSGTPSQQASSSAAPSEPVRVKPSGRFNHMNIASPTIQSSHPKIIAMRIKKGYFDFKTSSLSGAYLNKQDISGANLEGRDLRHLHLAWANASHTNFDGADLSNAQLYHANLRGASLRGANLTNAITWSTDFSDADLTGATVSAKHFAQAITNENTKREGMIILPDEAR